MGRICNLSMEEPGWSSNKEPELPAGPTAPFSRRLPLYLAQYLDFVFFRVSLSTALIKERLVMTEINAVVSNKAPAAIGPYSQAITANGMVYTSGVIPLDPETKKIDGNDISTQAERVLKSLASLLEDAGSSLDRVIKTTCFLQDLNDFATFNQIYASYFNSQPAPARSTVQVAKLPMGVLVEVEAIALLK